MCPVEIVPGLPGSLQGQSMASNFHHLRGVRWRIDLGALLLCYPPLMTFVVSLLILAGGKTFPTSIEACWGFSEIFWGFRVLCFVLMLFN